jgi:hypothetical protein
MARSKSISGSKKNRVKTNGEQADAGSAPNFAVTDNEARAVNAVAESQAAGNAPAEKIAVESLPGTRSVESKTGPDARKFEVVKSESRKNLVPINLEDEIRRRAYELYEQRGTGAGSEAEDWFAAEREVKQRYRQQTA